MIEETKKFLIADLANSSEVDKLVDRVVNDDITVKSIQFRAISHDGNLIYPTLVTYEDVDSQLLREQDELNELDEIAEKLQEDENYAQLKNMNQRELYLLKEHDVPSSQARKVIELVNMKKILRGE